MTKSTFSNHPGKIFLRDHSHVGAYISFRIAPKKELKGGKEQHKKTLQITNERRDKGAVQPRYNDKL